MRHFLLISLVFALGTVGCAHVPSHMRDLAPEKVQQLFERHLAAEPQFVPGEVIVKLKPSVSPQASTLLTLGVQAAEKLTSGGELIYRIAPTLAAALAKAEILDKTLALVKEMNEWEGAIYAQPNYILQVAETTPNDPRYPDQWHYFNNGSGPGESPGGINLPSMWEDSTGSTNVVVAVVDTGILPNHEDISGSPNHIGGFDMISDPARANDGDGREGDPTDSGDAVDAGECFPGSAPRSDSWHGTHVAGTVGVGKTNNAVGVAGVNWNVKVQAVRVLGKCGGTIVDINDGIRWAAGVSVPGVPDNPTPAKVINMSLGGRGACSLSPSTQAAIDDAVNAGATVVVAAGNEASDASGFFPASCNNVITVAASDYRGHLVSRYSNFGSVVDLMAPGGDVVRDDNDDNQNDGVLSMVEGGYARYNGTSMAAPHVAGAAALLLAQNPSLTPAQVRSTLVSTALSRTSSQCPKPCGAGLLQVARLAEDGPPPPPENGTPPSPPRPPRKKKKAPDITAFGLGFLVVSMVIFRLARRQSV